MAFGIRSLKKISVLVLAMLPVFLNAESFHGENHSRNGIMIDLTKQDWYAREGFEDSYINGFPTDNPLEVKKVRPKIILNELFNVPTGRKVNHFTLMTEFTINRSELKEPLIVQLAWIGENWALYLNGLLQRDEFYLNSDGSIKFYKTYRGVIVRLDPNALADGKNVLVFHIAGDAPPTTIASNDNTGLLYSGPYTVTTYDQIQGQQAEVLFIALYTVYFFFGLYHFLIFSRRFQDIYNLFFGLFSVALAVYGVSQTMFIYDFFFDTSVITRIKYAPQPLLIPLFLFFIHYYFYPDSRPSVFSVLSLGTGVILAVAFIAAPHYYLEFLLKIFYYIALPMIIYGVIYFVKVIMDRKKDVGIMSFSILLMILTAIFEIVDSMYFNTGIRLLKYSFFAFVMTLVGIMANRFLRVHNESERLNIELTYQKNAFVRFVPNQFLELLGKKSAVEIALGDSSVQTMSVLMCDLRSFTNMAESMSPEQTFSFLNSYLARMEPAIQKYDGFVDKFIGDAILALFSDSIHHADLGSMTTSDRSLQAAIDMHRELELFNRVRKDRGEPAVSFGIGINTGPLVLGTVGSNRRLDTTVIGNTVNMAARVESLTRFYGCRIIITDQTYRSLTNKQNILIREIDSVYVKGTTEPVIIYEVFEADSKQEIEKKLAIAEHLSRGIMLYKLRSFHEAIKAFRTCSEIYPEDRLANIYIERCEEYIANQPSESWNGIYEMRHK